MQGSDALPKSLGATGPADCSLVALVMSDPDLRERLAELRREYLRA